MSRIGDAIKKASHMYSEQWEDDKPDGGIVKQIKAEYVELGAAGVQHYYHHHINHQLRSAYLWQAGSQPFQSGEEAMQRTEELCMKRLVPILTHSFSDGVQIGQEQLPIVKKYRFFKKTNEIFGEQAFRTESDAFAMTVESDYEAMEFIEWYLRASAGFLASAGGYLMIDNPEDQIAISRVWDVWGLSTQSCVAGMYLAGYESGRAWAEEDMLEGILKATEES